MSELQVANWSEVLISDAISEIETGVSVNSENRRKGASEVGILKTSCISRGRFFPEEHKAVLADEVERAKTPLKAKSILMSRMNTPNLVGEIGYVQHQHPEIYLPDRLWMFSGKEGISDTLFLSHLLSSDAFRQKLSDIATGTSGSMKNIPQRSFLQIPIPLPPLPEQKKIAEILSGIDNLVRSLTEHNQKLEATKTALSKELISGHSGHRKESPYGQIPEHWIESTLGGIIGMANLQTGPFGSQLHAHEYTTEGIPVVMPQDMRKCGVVTDKIARITPDRAQTLEKHKVSPGDILFSRRGDIGRHAIISSNESGWICGTGCLRARTDGAINPIFLSELLRHKYALEWLNANAVGQTMLNLNTGILADLPVVVPPADEQEKIANSLSSINEQTRRIANKIWHTQNLKAAVASDLLSGRNRVSV